MQNAAPFVYTGMPSSYYPAMEKEDIGSEGRVAVVIPCYRVKDRVAEVARRSLQYAHMVICVDDRCPEGSGKHLLNEVEDPRLSVVFNEVNKGVGGAVKAGYLKAIELGASVAVKVDGDGQMDPSLIPLFVKPILRGRADYTKGNRFTRPGDYRSMPGIRLFGNAGLSLLTKPSTGYWRTLDPTNGYTAASCPVLKLLPLEKVDDGYFFETDMLHHLRSVDAVVTDIPMKAVYDGENSSLNWKRALFPFFFKHLRNTISRIYFQYFIKDFGMATVQLCLGLLFTAFGSVMGLLGWSRSISTGVTASAGSVMLAALPVILGFQMLLGFLSYDMASIPVTPLTERLEK